MDENTSIDLAQPWFKSRFLYLIVAIIALILVAPLLQSYIRIRSLLDIFSSIVIIIAVSAVSRKKHHIGVTPTTVQPAAK